MALRYTTVKEFWDYLGLTESILDYQPSNVTDGAITNLKETVKSSPVSAGAYYLKQKAVNPDTLVLYAGSTALTETTDYTFDSDTSAVTITSAGATALSGEDLEAVYEYCSLGNSLNYNKTVDVLEASESELEQDTQQRFSNTTSPTYRQVTNEEKTFPTQTYRINMAINTKYNPLVKIQTTVDGDYTSGNTEITLTDASTLPDSGTLYIGGYKVTYSGKSSNVLTIPPNTPSISDGATVDSLVVEISLASEGSSDDWDVLTPDEDYNAYYDYGYIKLLSTAYFNQVSVSNVNNYPNNIKLRVSYMNAWHEDEQDPIIPSEVVECVYQIAARNVRRRTVFKSHVGQRDNFTPTTSTESKEFIDRVKQNYCVQLINIK